MANGGEHLDEPAFKLSEDASEGDLVAVKADLAAKTPVDSSAADGETALGFAAANGRLEVVRLLLPRGRTPMYGTSKAHHPL
jgi:ankyrin repeat protein